MKTAILKNTTASEIFVLHRQIPAFDQDDFSTENEAHFRRDSNLLTLIAAGDIVVNDGTSDLDSEIGQSYVSGSIAIRDSGATQSLGVTGIDFGKNLVITNPSAGVQKVDASISLEKDDAAVTGSPHDTINFEGNVTVVDEGSGKATVTVGPAGGTLDIFQITGSDSATSEPMAFVTDTTRSSKVLSIECSNLDFGHDAPDDDSWFRPGNKHLDKALNGYILPYDGTVVRMSAHCASVKSNTKNLSVYINASETTSVVTLTGAAEDQDETTDVNIDFSAGDKLRIRARNGSGGRMDETVVAVWVKWRKV